VYGGRWPSPPGHKVPSLSVNQLVQCSLHTLSKKVATLTLQLQALQKVGKGTPEKVSLADDCKKSRSPTVQM